MLEIKSDFHIKPSWIVPSDRWESKKIISEKRSAEYCGGGEDCKSDEKVQE